MIIALAFCSKNKDITVRLMQWLSELGWMDKHDCLLGVHADTDSHGVIEVAQRIFKRAAEFTIDDTETIYPFIANVMWKRCAMHIADMNESAPWFWLEPDAVPLVPEWLDWIEAEYKRAGKPFLLDRVITPTSTHNSGIGVYPARVRDYTMQLWNLSNVPWDVFFKDDFTPHTQHTTLIHDKFYAVMGDPKSGEPTFPDAASLAQIESGAVIFHRNKDGSLIQRLRESRGNKVFRDATLGKSASPQNGWQEITPSSFVSSNEITSRLIVEGCDDDPEKLKARIFELERIKQTSFARIAELEQQLAAAQPRQNVKPVKKKRTAMEQARIDERMAKMRDRKKKLTGVL